MHRLSTLGAAIAVTAVSLSLLSVGAPKVANADPFPPRGCLDNTINDPKHPLQCIPCPTGSHPDAKHHACIFPPPVLCKGNTVEDTKLIGKCRVCPTNTHPDPQHKQCLKDKI